MMTPELLLQYFFYNPTGQTVFFLLAAWSLAWKGVALWKSARYGQRGWFLAVLVLNTLGILEIIYLAYFSKSAKPGA